VGLPSDESEAVRAIDRLDADTVVLSLTSRDPDGRDAEYLEWHALDHRPEQHRLPALRGALRGVSTPACRAARASVEGPLDAVDHLMAYLFTDADGLGPFLALGAALGGDGRMPHRLASVDLDVHEVRGRAAAPRVLVGADVIPWRPARGLYLLVERGEVPAGDLVEVPGVAGVWWARRSGDGSDRPQGDQVAIAFLDDDAVTAAGALAPVLARRWADTAAAPVLAAPFEIPVPFAWDRHLP